MNASALPSRVYTITIDRLVEEEQLESEDLSVPSDWDVKLPIESVTENWTPGRCATYVLDDFHESVAIAVLDDFEIRVFDPAGEEICEDFEDEEDLSEDSSPAPPAGPKM